MSNQPRINYEPEADVLSYEITNQPIDYAKEVGNIVVHFTSNHIPVLVEILEATKFLKKAEKLTADSPSLSAHCAR